MSLFTIGDSGGIRSVVTYDSIAVYWQKPQEPVEKYEIYLNGILAGETEKTHYEFLGLQPETGYMVTIKALRGNEPGVEQTYGRAQESAGMRSGEDTQEIADARNGEDAQETADARNGKDPQETADAWNGEDAQETADAWNGEDAQETVDARNRDEAKVFGELCLTTEKAGRRIDVTREPYCAAGDGETMDTAAIQRALDDCGEGETVYFPAGIYLTGALRLHSDMELYLEKGAVLQGTDEPADYMPRIWSRFEGVEP